MEIFPHFQSLFWLGLIVGLLLIGLFVAARSGVVSASSPEGCRLFLSNLSQILIRVFGYMVGLLAVQQFVGFPLGLIW